MAEHDEATDAMSVLAFARAEGREMLKGMLAGPLERAARTGNFRAFTAAINLLGGDVCMESGVVKLEGRPPLKLIMAAAEGGNLNIIQKIIEARGDTEKQAHLVNTVAGIRDKKSTTLLVAVRSGNLAVVTKLIECGAEIEKCGGRGRVALHEAAELGYVDILHYLVSRRAEVGAKMNNGLTALHLASGRGHVECVGALLVSRKGDVDAGTNSATTPLYLAALHGHTKVAEMLLEAGADPNLATVAGDTALHVSSRALSLHNVQLLLAAGADQDQVNEDGVVPAAVVGAWGDRGSKAEDICEVFKTAREGECASERRRIFLRNIFLRNNAWQRRRWLVLYRYRLAKTQHESPCFYEKIGSWEKKKARIVNNNGGNAEGATPDGGVNGDDNSNHKRFDFVDLIAAVSILSKPSAATRKTIFQRIVGFL